MTQDTMSGLRELRRSGLSYREISDRTGVSVFRVRQATHDCTVASDPIVAELVASGLTDIEVATRAGINPRTLSGWRQGRKPTPFLVECVREALTKNTPGY